MLNRYQPGVFNNFGGNRAVGFNRATWRFGNAIGRAARPYVNNAASRIRSYLSSRSSIRSARTDASRASRAGRRPGLDPAQNFRGSSLRGRQVAIAGGDSESFFTLRRPKRSSTVKLDLIKSVVVNNSGLRATSLIGKQNAVNIGTYFDAVNIATLYTDEGIAGKTTKLVLDSVHAESIITNCENSNAKIYLYDVLARRDSQTNVSTPMVAFQQGFADAGGGAAADNLVPGATPFDCSRFGEWFKIVKITEITLAPGATHTHKVHYEPNKLFSHELDTLVQTGCIGNLSLYTFMIHHGSPSNDSTTKTSATVTLTPSNLDIVQKQSMRFSYCHQDYQTNSIVNSLPLTYAVGGEIMNDVGLILADTAA